MVLRYGRWYNPLFELARLITPPPLWLKYPVPGVQARRLWVENIHGALGHHQRSGTEGLALGSGLAVILELYWDNGK